MSTIDVQINPAQQEDIEETLKGVAGGVGKATSAAINRTMTHTRAVSARKIQAHINLPIAVIKESIDAKRNKATPKHPVGIVRFSHKPVPLINYKARDQHPAGVSVVAQKDKGTQVFRHAFIATMPGGHVGVFERIPGTRHRNSQGRWVGRFTEKLKELYGPSVEGTFANAPGIVRDTMADSGEFLARQLASQVNRLLNRKKVIEDDGGDDE